MLAEDNKGRRAMFRGVTCFLGLLLSLPAISHHSNSSYQVDQIITITGTVKEWRWSNPHTWLLLTVEGEDGAQTDWAVEGRAPGILRRAGWDRNVLTAGETVMVYASPSKNGSPIGIISRVTKADGSILAGAPNFGAVAESPVTTSATATPNFSGVYFPYRPNAQGGAASANERPAGPRPPPTRTGPTSDGSLGRRSTDPKLLPEYLAQWEIIAESLTAGSYEYDNIANCLPPGMPSMMSMPYGMEVMQSNDKITFFSEHQDALRRVYLDGRRPSETVLDDPTYAGYSTGRWDDDTLIIETVALSTNSYITGKTPHSAEMSIRENIRFIAPGILEDRVTVNDPQALLEPWEVVYTYRRAAYPNDELREFACAEGLGHAAE
jgi:hypothetical protein